VFPLPGWRGGLFHGAAALVPWWAALAVVGLDRAVDWIAKRRRAWKPQQAKAVFTVGIILLAAVLSLTNLAAVPRGEGNRSRYQALADALPDDARVLINDPAQWYAYTGQGGAVLPNESPEVIPQIAARYGITHVILEQIVTDGDVTTYSTASPAPLQSILSDPPDFLRPVDVGSDSVRVYEIVD